MLLPPHNYKIGDTIFLNGKRLTITNLEPTVHQNNDTQYIYVDTKEQGVTAIPVW